MAGRATAHPARAFFHFHLRVGVRLAERSMLPLFGVFTIAFIFLRPEFFANFAAALLAGGMLLSSLAAVIVLLPAAWMAARQVCFGLTGWIRHLPLDGTRHRRLALSAVFYSLFPLQFLLGALAVSAWRQYPAVPLWPALIGLPLTALAAAAAALPVERRHTAGALAAAAALCTASCRPAGIALGMALLVVGDRVSGPLVPLRRRVRRRGRGGRLQLALARRAVGWRMVLPAAAGLCILGLTWLSTVNNRFGGGQRLMEIRLGSGLALTVACALLAQSLAVRRPPWPWSRSLPWSASRRVGWDALFLALCLLPLLVPAVLLAPAAGLVVAAALPALAVYAALAVRRTERFRYGAVGQIVKSGGMAAVLTALHPLTVPILLLLTLRVWRAACTAERSRKVTLWQEKGHAAAGDSQSWSSS